MHIHFGKKGVAGPVIIGICLKPCSLPKSGTLTSKQFAKAPGVSNFAAAVKAGVLCLNETRDTR